MIGFLGRWASGDIKTGATFLWELALKHSDYKEDSILTNKMNYDIVWYVSNIGRTNWPEDLLGPQPYFIDEIFQDLEDVL